LAAAGCTLSISISAPLRLWNARQVESLALPHDRACEAELVQIIDAELDMGLIDTGRVAKAWP
jgi:hypothetical protein